LQSRGTETPENLSARLNKATYELTFKDHFDKTIVNDNLEKACKEVEEVVKSFIES
jgi:guanylate kinase